MSVTVHVHVSSRNGSTIVTLLIKFVNKLVERLESQTRSEALAAKIKNKIADVCAKLAKLKAKGSTACDGIGKFQNPSFGMTTQHFNNTVTEQLSKIVVIA